MKSLYLFLFILLFSQGFATIERRVAIDVGSGSTKVAIADVDSDLQEIVQLIAEMAFPVPYQANLDKSADGNFDHEIQSIGLKTFREINELSKQYKAQKISAIATSAFRKSNNAKAFVKEIEKQTGISVQIIDQKEEGEIAFFSALSSKIVDPDAAVVWDIGTGSLQMTTKNSSGGLSVYMGEQMGSIAFKTYIIETIQECDIENKISPNPISEKELELADRFARAFGRKAFSVIKEKIKVNEGKVIGIGRLFYHSLRPIASTDQVISRKGLRNYIEHALNKTDEELDNPFAHVDVSNCILTLAIMKALHIQEIQPLETTTTRGMLIDPSYWIIPILPKKSDLG